MDSKDVYVVTRTEESHHYLPTCPCVACESERRRRVIVTSTDSHLRTMPVGVAYVLGFIRKRTPGGSVARKLANDHRK